MSAPAVRLSKKSARGRSERSLKQRTAKPMALPRPEYELTEAADSDLLAIARYTIKTWGIEQVHRYEAALEGHSRSIAQGNVRRRAFSPNRPDLFFTHCEHHY